MTPQTDYQRERQLLLDRYTVLYLGVAAHLPGWRVESMNPDNDAQYRLKLANTEFPGQSIHMEIYGKRITVSGRWPMVNPWPQGPSMSPSDVREGSPSITVSADKIPAKIANDIAKRFLPEYQRIYALLETRRQADARYKENKTANFEHLVGMGQPLFRRSHNNERATFSMKGEGYGHLEMSGETTVTFELRSIPRALALDIIRALVKGDV